MEARDNPCLVTSSHPSGLAVEGIASIGAGLFLSLMDTTIVATMLYNVSEEFGGFRMSPWIVLSYTLSYVGFSVLSARLSDSLGRKPVLLASFVVFLAASMACAASKNMDQLIGFRAAQGAGGAGLYALAMIIYPEICPPNMVPAISAVVGIVVALAGVSGPIIGGALTSYADWRYGFWINGPCAFVPGVILLFAWPKNMLTFAKVPFKNLDYVGTLFILGSTVLLVFIVNEAAIREFTWDSGPTISVLIISGLCWIAMVLWQREISRNPKFRHIRPQFPWQVLTDRVMMCALGTSVLAGFVMFLAIVHIPMRAQIVNLYDAVKAGILLLPLMGSMAVGSMLGGAVSSKKNNTFWTLNIASILTLVGSGLLSTLGETISPEPKQWGFEVILGFGLGLNMSTATFITSLQVKFEYHAVSQGILAQLRVFGGSMGVAAGFIVLNKEIQDSLSGVLSPEQLQDFYRSPIAIFGFSVYQQLRVRQAYISAFNTNMRVCIGLSALSVVAALCTYQRRPPSVQKRLEDLEKIFAQTAALDAAQGA
ncbi:MFS general substrate transporter [Coniochaeta ligniaria NRRL 30616]|uniref:MFS general substrate transporter n=1 Tax=Coniochaeta ligniaria NRRL 30616 TaxID=1408157 RepID=A0A1J7K1J2_9PEZI|nr:MFS general substrate transporter [Coniochaeta ligniaria NRRL 30616]